ncbi:hypothetical protein SCHPADRAFT_359453 [Schizopora paradoxa]|uniref:DUF6534 domain-containing protein n=1 Tax=Schizopora paradoxa TaxID=27342 RepID=A0A0H2S9L1_9AGAM|nr:hypothetical protein SCHPADRAFT_359453 [Schizopora paradoxa]
MTIVDDSVGQAIVGCILSSIFFGVTVTQTINYYQDFVKDNWYIRTAVILTFLVDVFHTILVSHGTYVYTLGTIEDLGYLLIIPWSYQALTVVSGINVVLVRCFFVHRIWILSNKGKFITGFHFILMLGAFCAAMASGIRVLFMKTFLIVSETPWVIYSTRCSSMITDIAIATTTSYYLMKTSTTVMGTSQVLSTLVFYIVCTGCITAIWDILETSTYASSRHTLHFAVYFLSLPKLHVNALLASLNARSTMKSKLVKKGVSLHESSASRSGLRGKESLNLSQMERDSDLVLPPLSKGRSQKPVEVGIEISFESDAVKSNSTFRD